MQNTLQVAAPAQVIITEHGRVLHIMLNRPRQLNALNTAMCRTISRALSTVTPAKYDAVVFTGSGAKGFCGGGDVKAMLASSSAAQEFLRAEYEMDLLVANCPVPTVAVLHGITMGGGLGIAAHCRIRIVTPDSRLAMPETRIGIVPDVGINRLLALTPPGCGEIMAATSCEITAADACALGFADYLLPAESIPELLQDIFAGVDPARRAAAMSLTPPPSALITQGAALAAALRRAENAQADLPAPNQTALETAAHTARLETTAGTVALATAVSTVPPVVNTGLLAITLLQTLQNSSPALAAQLATVSPQAAAIALARVWLLRKEQAAQGGITVATALQRDYALLATLVTRQDFQEGVAAQLIRKDKQPSWQPATIAALCPAATTALLAAEQSQTA